MSIEESNVVDFVGVEKATGNVVLTISDHLDWSDTGKHIALLEDKLNAYLRFIESGEIHKEYPRSEGRQVIISIVGKYPVPVQCQKFLEEAKSIINGAGIGLLFEESVND